MGVSCLLLMFVLFHFTQAEDRNNVCRSLPDYATISTNPSCWYNPDVGSSMGEITKRNGYPIEKHDVTTDDGYILTLNRIPHNNTEIRSLRQPVLIYHGLAGSPTFWVIQGQNSLAFFLVNNGYDVWLASVRGSDGLRRHRSGDISYSEFWDFGLDEMATNDLPAIVTYISRINDHKGKIIYIGHSMGTTLSYMYAIENGTHANEHLSGIVSLAPVAYTNHMQGLLRKLAPLSIPIRNILRPLDLVAIGDIPIVNRILMRLCGKYPTVKQCAVLLALTSGLAPKEARADMVPVFFSYYPSATSLKVLQHYAQMILSNKKFQKFDYGHKNIIKYGRSTTPEYDISKITLPVYLFAGTKDLIADLQDVNDLYRKLKTTGKNRGIYYLNYSHNDFFLGRHFKYFYQTLLDVFNKINNSKVAD